MKKSLILLYLPLIFGSIACGNVDKEEVLETNEDNGNSASGFVVTDVGMTYAMIETSKDNLIKVIQERFGDNYSNFSTQYKDLGEIISDLFYIQFGENEDFSNSTKIKGNVEGNNVRYELNLSPGKKYYYQIFTISMNGTYTSDGHTYSLTSKSLNRSNVIITTGEPEVTSGGYLRRIFFNDNVVVIKDISIDESMWVGIVFFYENEKEYLSEKAMNYVWNNKEDNLVVNFISLSYHNKNGLSNSDKALGTKSFSYNDRQLKIEFSPGKSMSRNRSKGTYYYCPLVYIGGEIILGEIKTVDFQ